jgi:uncharacterized membrane protein
MAKDIQDRIGQILGSDTTQQLAGAAVNKAFKAFSAARSNGSGGGDSSASGGDNGPQSGNGKSPLGGMRGLAAGAGAAALAPVAAKGIGKLIKGPGKLASGPRDLAEGAASKLGDSVGSKVTDKVDEAGGPSGILKDTVKSALPFGGGGGGRSGKQDTEGVGKGRRMPIQQKWDIGLPIETVYNQWTQFEEWPKFMHRVTRVTQEDPCKVSFAVKIWGKTKEFTADIETQRPNDRIKWKTTQGMNHTGVVTFRELGPNMTRVMLSFDVDPGSLLEKYARGTRYVKRAARADFHRFVAFIEMLEHETGAWRGVIEDGELVEDHDPSYDEQREYADPDELVHGRGSDEDEDEESDEEDADERDEEGSTGRNGDDPEHQRSRRQSRPRAQAARSSGSSRSSSGGSRSSSGGSRSSRSGGSSGSSRSSSGGSRSSRSGGSSGSSRSSSGGSRSSRSGGSSGNGRSSAASSRSSSSRSTGRSGSGSGSGSRSSGSSRSSSRGASRSSGRSGGSSGTSGGASRGSSGRSRSRSTSGSSRSSKADHQGRQTRSSRRG